MATTGPNPAIDTTDAPIDNTLQPAAAPAAAPPAAPPMQPSTQPPAQPPAQPPQEEPPGSHFKNLSHALQGAVLGALAGGKKVLGALSGPSEVIDGYETNESGKQTPKYRQLHTGDKLQRIALAALQGLAAGSQVPQQKSGMASALAGVGAGAASQINEQKQDDLLKRQQSKEQFEQEQKAMTDKYIRAQHNITTYSLWQKGMEDANQHDPDRQKTEAIKTSAQDYISRNPGTSMNTQTLSESEAKAMQAADKNNPASTTHVFFPYGMREVKQDGQTVYEKDGVTPKKEGQVLVIGGGSKDGKMPLPQTFVEDLKKYGKMAGITGLDSVKAGDEWQLDRFLTAGSRMNPVKEQEIEGWKEKKLGENAVMIDGQYQQENMFTHEMRPYGANPLESEKISAQIDKDKADAEKARADAAKARSEASGDNLNQLARDLYEHRFPPNKIAGRKPEVQAKIIAEADRLAKLEGKGGYDFEKDLRDWNFANNIGTQNTLKYLKSLTGADNKSGNLGALISKSDSIKRTSFPSLNDKLAWAKLRSGDRNVAGYMTDVLEVSDQVAKILQGGGSGNGTSDAKLEQAKELFNLGWTKQQMRDIATELRGLLGNRKTEMIGDNVYLLKDEPKQQQQTQRPPGVPDEASQVYTDPKTNAVVGYALNGKYVALPKTGKQ